MRAAMRTLCLAAMLHVSPGSVSGGPSAMQAVRWSLDPGTTAVLVEDHRAPLIELRIVFPAGKWSPWFRRVDAGDAFAVQLHDPAGRLRRRADGLAASLSLRVGDRSSVLAASCLKEDLPELLQLVRDVLANRDLDRRELKRRGRTRMLEWRTSLKSPWFRGVQAAARNLFEVGDPRRLPYEKPAPVATDRVALVAARDRLIRLPGRTVALAGDLTRPEVASHAASLLPPVERLPVPDLEPRLQPLRPFELRDRDVVVALPRLTQVYFGYGRDSLPRDDPRYPAFTIADHVLGGHFYSRLYVALRHEGGETYGASTSDLGDVAVGPYGLGTFTRASNAAATEVKLREVLRVFHRDGITEQERSEAVGWLRGRRPFSRQSPAQVLDRHLQETTLGLPEGFGDDLVDRAAALDLRTINAFISEFFDPGRFTMIRVE